jgi:ankyrin repeat protein
LIGVGGKCAAPLMRSTTSLMNAIKENNIQKVEGWLSISPKLVNSTDYEGRTPLHIAASNDRLDIIKILLKYSIFIPNFKRQT